MWVVTRLVWAEETGAIAVASGKEIRVGMAGSLASLNTEPGMTVVVPQIIAKRTRHMRAAEETSRAKTRVERPVRVFTWTTPLLAAEECDADDEEAEAP